jgi:homoserine O-acetyltransferase/O-succinyltransferase
MKNRCWWKCVSMATIAWFAASATHAQAPAAQQAPPDAAVVSGQAEPTGAWTATLKSADYTIANFKFRSGESLPSLRIHYYTLGAPHRDANGTPDNAILLLHGTGGSGRQFFTSYFAGVAFGPGQLLDAQKYFIIMPDNVGHGRSSKPSDGLRAKFPQYDYDDMVAAQYSLVTQGLGLNHLLLVMGTSMGCMHSWVWGETYPQFMDGLVPLACEPVEIGGRNRMMRKMVMDAITTDPDYKGGNYKVQPHGLQDAIDILLLMGSVPLEWQKNYPTREQADAYLEEQRKARLATTDANDMLYAFNASRNYNPEPKLQTIQAQALFINSADDAINPPELGIAEREIQKVKNGRFVLIPISDQTRGHSTHSRPAIWGSYLEAMLNSLGH